MVLLWEYLNLCWFLSKDLSSNDIFGDILSDNTPSSDISDISIDNLLK